MNMPTTHIQFAKLADLVEGRLLPPERAGVEQHVATCAQCSADVQWLRRTLDLMHTDASEDAPAHVVAHAVRLFRSPQPAPSPLRRILAALQWDSGHMEPSFGVRSGAVAARQLLLNAGPYDVDLRIRPEGSAWVVAGQVLGPSAHGRVMLHSAAKAAETDLNAQSEFVLPVVPEGSYTLTLRLADAAITFEQLELGA